MYRIEESQRVQAGPMTTLLKRFCPDRRGISAAIPMG
jgi:hypothetical protein